MSQLRGGTGCSSGAVAYPLQVDEVVQAMSCGWKLEHASPAEPEQNDGFQRPFDAVTCIQVEQGLLGAADPAKQAVDKALEQVQGQLKESGGWEPCKEPSQVLT